MRRVTTTLPPIAIEERSEKLALTLPTDLKASLEAFGRFFADVSGETPTSFNAIVVGVLSAYLSTHVGYQKWLKASPRANGRGIDVSAPSP